MSNWASYEINQLDDALAEDGEWIEIWRLTGTQQIPVKVECRAHVISKINKELVGVIAQDQDDVVISPTEIMASGWPGPETHPPSTLPTAQDRRVPRKGDKALIKGKLRNIEDAKPRYIDDELTRIELVVLG